MLERAGVVTQHGSIPNAHAAAVDDEDSARLEWLERAVDCFSTTMDTGLAPQVASVSMSVSARSSSSRLVIEGRMAEATTVVGRTL